MSNNSINDVIKKIGNKIDIECKPDDVDISTMTVTCKLNLLFNTVNIGKYIELNRNAIVEIAPPPPGKIRSLLPKKDTYKKKVKKRFYNQISLSVVTNRDKIINTKLFSNGSIQMTGCKSIEGAIEALDKIIIALSKQLAKINYETKKIMDIQFVSNPSQLSLDKIQNFNVAMINSNFTIGFSIDRAKLFSVICKDKTIDGSYDPIMHAGVSMKYHDGDREISIFVFESGSIVITGARNCKHIKGAYNFVNKFLLENYMDIVMTETVSDDTLSKYLTNIKI